MQHVTCPGCDADEAEPWGSENGYHAGKCRRCGLVYVNPRPTGEEITEAHRLGMHATDTGALNIVVRRDPRKTRAMRKRIAALFAEEIGKGEPLRWLDVGAGNGETVEAAAAVLPPGSAVCGIEPMPAKVAEARKRGLEVSATPLAALAGPYDVVSLINVFSHIPDFRAFGREIAGLLAPGGILWIETGNAGSIPRSAYPDRLYLPDHLVFAGPDQIEPLLTDMGFETIAIEHVRVDGPVYTAKTIAKSLLDGRFAFRFPYTSRFRQSHYKARKRG